MAYRRESSFGLKDYNTFGIDVTANEFIECNSEKDLHQAYESGIFENPHLILGGGSNILLTGDIPGTVVKINIKGKKVISEKDEFLIVECGAGENWHEFVLYCIENNWGGLENLSLIPGTVGAAPMQNIGAYGVEIKEVFDSLKAFDKIRGEFVWFFAEDCEFDYRSSIFKTKYRDRFIIAQVRFKLSKQHKLNISYGAISSTLKEKGITKPGISDVSRAVIEIRRSKLPDPKEIGNAGSFFKNPIISVKEFKALKKSYSEIPSYEVDPEHVKVPAAWLIEKSGWKGRSYKSTGVHDKQALVLINPGNAKGIEVLELAEIIQKEVKDKFNIELEKEVNII